jgi:hypothetical protein
VDVHLARITRNLNLNKTATDGNEEKGLKPYIGHCVHEVLGAVRFETEQQVALQAVVVANGVQRTFGVFGVVPNLAGFSDAWKI